MSNLLITRFPSGSGGNFISTVLQTSMKIDHWNSVIQTQKELQKFVEETTLIYCERSFPVDHARHMVSEPMMPYSNELYSSTFDRGNDVTADQYWSQKDSRLISCVEKNLTANLIFHKNPLPKFCDGAKVLTVLVTSEDEKNWLDKTLYSKHFIEIGDRIIYTPRSLDHCSLKAVPKLLEYNAQCEYPLAKKDEIFTEMVKNNTTNLQYTNPENFDNKNYQNIFFHQEYLLDRQKFLDQMSLVFEEFNLGTLDTSLVRKMHNIWLDRQI